MKKRAGPFPPYSLSSSSLFPAVRENFLQKREYSNFAQNNPQFDVDFRLKNIQLPTPRLTGLCEPEIPSLNQHLNLKAKNPFLIIPESNPNFNFLKGKFMSQD